MSQNRTSATRSVTATSLRTIADTTPYVPGGRPSMRSGAVPYPEHLASMGNRFWTHLCRLNDYGTAFALLGVADAAEKLSLSSPAAIEAFRTGLPPAPPPVSIGVEWPTATSWSALVEPGAKALRMLVTLARRVDMREYPRVPWKPMPHLRLVTEND